MRLNKETKPNLFLYYNYLVNKNNDDNDDDDLIIMNFMSQYVRPFVTKAKLLRCHNSLSYLCHILHDLILFKSQLLKKSCYILSIFIIIYIQIICTYINTYK